MEFIEKVEKEWEVPAAIGEDTLPLHVARSGTKRPAPVAMLRLSETCRPCLGAKDMPKHLRRWLLKVFTYRCRHFPLQHSLKISPASMYYEKLQKGERT